MMCLSSFSYVIPGAYIHALNLLPNVPQERKKKGMEVREEGEPLHRQWCIVLNLLKQE